MHSKRSLGFAALGLVTVAVVGVAPAFAQGAGFQLGGQVTALRIEEFDATDIGIGVQAVWRFAPGLAVDGMVNLFPGSNDSSPTIDAQQRVLGLVGVRAGVERGPAELFVKVRPGFLRFSEEEGVACIAIFPPPLSCGLLGGYTAFATELGGGVQVRLTGSDRLYVWFDAGDLLVRYESGTIRPGGDVREGFVDHNLVLAAGLGWRF